MSDWTDRRIPLIAQADDLRIAPFRPDGVTPGTPTWVWSVVVDGRLFVRPYHGRDSRWYQAAMAQQAGRISVAGDTYEVAFAAASRSDDAVPDDAGPDNAVPDNAVPDDADLLDRIDDAYRAKYASSPYLPPLISTSTRSTTVEITPRVHGEGAFAHDRGDK